jgi:hypothetical protein
MDGVTPPGDIIAWMIYDLNANPLNANEWAFPLTECFHIASFALSIGTIAVVDLRMLGLGLLKQTPAQLVKDTGLWTLAGLLIVITSGLAIFSSDPVMYYYNRAFRFKISALLIGIIYNYTIHRRVALSGASGTTSVVVGALSAAIWLSVVFGGIFIAFI